MAGRMTDAALPQPDQAAAELQAMRMLPALQRTLTKKELLQPNERGASSATAPA
jgi:hypothetical protein